MATTAPDMTTFFKDIMEAFPVDTKLYQDAFDNSAEMNEKMTKVALQAAQQSADISSKWTKDTLGKSQQSQRQKPIQRIMPRP